jgi:hypothetical protein
MAYELCEHDLQKIAQLPLWIQQLKDKYPLAVYNTSDAYYLNPLPAGYRPEEVEVYYGDDYEGSDLYIEGTELIDFNLETPSDPSVIQLRIDGDWAYIQVGGQVILDRLKGVILPEIVMNHEALLRSILTARQSNI